MTAAELTSVATVRPARRLDLGEVSRFWGRDGRGTLAVVGPDEDAVTMAVAAADRLSDLTEVTTVILARPTVPPGSGDGAAVLATALGLPATVRTFEVTGSDRCFTTALSLAGDIVAADGSTHVLVVVADDSVREAGSAAESTHGHGATAVLVGPNSGAGTLLCVAGRLDPAPDAWQRPDGVRANAGDRFLATAVAPPHLQALVADDPRLRDLAGRATGVHGAASTPKLGATLANQLVAGLPSVGSDAWELGDAGAATAGMILARILGRGQSGEVHLIVAPGSGIDVLAVEVGDGSSVYLPAADVEGERLPYGTYLRSTGQTVVTDAAPTTSPVTMWRDQPATLGLQGARCVGCTRVTYPEPPVCGACGGHDLQPVDMRGSGVAVTATTDHIVAGVNPGTPESPTTMVVVERDGGGRLFLPAIHGYQPSVGARVRTVLRLAHRGGGFRNYYWRVEPSTAATRRKQP